jgi:formylglycine-generating enzyme required for sulfatase activity
VYFTMKLVKGRDLKAIFDLVFGDKEGWNETRALSAILKVCEAVAYAHKKGVIHRDLKPGNVMVGSFGEVYVMDWGLARVLGRKDAHDIRIRPEFASALSSVKSERREAREETPDSPIVTMDGDVLGTPAYMAPEQARGEIERLGPRSDVYAVGAMLYQLLTHEIPYVRPGERITNRTVLARLLDGPPKSIPSVRPGVPPELVSICDKAMARDADARYADTLELAEDLRAFLERRVVRAHKTGAWAEAKKWVERNKALASSLAAAVAILVAGVIVSELQAKRAVEQDRISTQRANDVLSLSAIQELKELVERADELWPAFPDKIAEYDRWLELARVLVDGRAADPVRGAERHLSLADHEAKLANIRLRAKAFRPEQLEPRNESGSHSRPTDPAASVATHAKFPESEVSRGRKYEFDDAQDRWWHEQLSSLVRELKAFADEKTGVFSRGTSQQHGWGIVKRREEAATIEERSLTGADVQRRWSEAIAAISRSEKYGGLKLTPQLGLLPIGEDPRSHLWEFAHLQTGVPAQRGADGTLMLRNETGLVLVLLPDGSFWMGAQHEDRLGRNYDPKADKNEQPVLEVTLAPFFFSKYEMTQGQWERFQGSNPSAFKYGEVLPVNKPVTQLNPVENVSWIDCDLCMRRMGLMLPTEAQWEFAARSGTTTPWFTGSDRGSLKDHANVADQYMEAHEPDSTISEYELWDDGNAGHAPVGSYSPNAFGLHDTAGNVMEWCRDLFSGYECGVSLPDGERLCGDVNMLQRMIRGGAFDGNAMYARSAKRVADVPRAQMQLLGVRPARKLDG